MHTLKENTEHFITSKIYSNITEFSVLKIRSIYFFKEKLENIY